MTISLLMNNFRSHKKKDIYEEKKKVFSFWSALY